MDAGGATASLLCAIHCALMPILVTLLPLVGLGFLASETTEWVVVALSGVLGVSSLTGPAHMLFIVALLLISTSFRSLVKTLTGFTIAHSITLILSALSVIVLDNRLVDIFIALSIIYVGLENIYSKKPTTAASGWQPRLDSFMALASPTPCAKLACRKKA